METSQIDALVKGLAKLEFFVEQILNYFGKEKIKFSTLAEVLGIFELAKLHFRYKKFKSSSNLNKIFISEENNVDPNVDNTQNNKDLFQEHDQSADSIENPTEGKNKIKTLLSNLKNQCFRNHAFNHAYEETLEKSQKKINILSSLPIPNEMFQKNTEDEGVKKKIFYGELIYLLRPVIYNLLLILKGKDSFLPYFCSLLLDLIRLFLQKQIVFYSHIEKKEFIFRKKELLICYLLRNPFYATILKTRVIEPFLNKFLGRLPLFSMLKTVILYFIEIRSSLALLM